jgi:DNA-binding MarR family transcriptional regulator
MHTQSRNIVGAWALEAADLMASHIVPSGLGEREAAALVLVAGHPDRGIDWLSGRLALTHSGTVRLVDRLVEHGLLVRAPGSNRRVARLRVTDAGREHVEQISASRASALDRLLGCLSDEEQTLFADLAGRMLRARDRDRPAADRACRLCDWPACEPRCPVDESVTGG